MFFEFSVEGEFGVLELLETRSFKVGMLFLSLASFLLLKSFFMVLILFRAMCAHVSL